jgi:hypothetical protein
LAKRIKPGGPVTGEQIDVIARALATAFPSA